MTRDVPARSGAIEPRDARTRLRWRIAEIGARPCSRRAGLRRRDWPSLAPGRKIRNGSRDPRAPRRRDRRATLRRERAGEELALNARPHLSRRRPIFGAPLPEARKVLIGSMVSVHPCVKPGHILCRPLLRPPSSHPIVILLVHRLLPRRDAAAFPHFRSSAAQLNNGPVPPPLP